MQKVSSHEWWRDSKFHYNAVGITLCEYVVTLLKYISICKVTVHILFQLYDSATSPGPVAGASQATSSRLESQGGRFEGFWS